MIAKGRIQKWLRYGIWALGAAALAIGVVWWKSTPRTDTLFEDVTPYSGISYVGVTYGAAWGDFDGDGLPDLYLTDHLNDAKLFRNLGKGRFADVTKQFFSPKDLTGDKHGAAWADFNNDGRQDLVLLAGAAHGVGEEAKHLFLNRGTRFEDIAATAGVANVLGRTRMPLWVDLNGDGQLDLLQGAETRFDKVVPPFVFIQHAGKFLASDDTLQFASRTAPFCVLTALRPDSRSDVICRVSAHTLTAQFFDTATQPLRASAPLPQTAFEDIAAGDFDNDGFIDLYLARRNPPGPVAFGRRSTNQVIADTVLTQANIDKPIGFSFRTSGHISFNVAPVWPSDWLKAEQIHVGAQGMRPDSFALTLSPETAHAKGTASHQPGAQAGLYVGQIAPDRWQVFVSGARDLLASSGSKYQEVAVTMTSSRPITDLQPIGASVAPEEAPARLFMNRNGKLVEEGDKRGVNARPIAAVNVVAGDFDNDMHLDLFVVGSGEIGKQENLLLLNRGDGHFDVVRGAGGAAGGPTGIGDSVTTTDFDGDGFLDLLVATGGSMGRSEGPPSEVGTYHLYHNRGNGNHWIEIDLEGTVSNRDGIGARVYVTAGGITQVRVQDGGVHNRGQNFQRLHFGLAKYTQIEKLKILWPSGVTQELSKVAADQLIRIKEPPRSGPANVPGTSK